MRIDELRKFLFLTSWGYPLIVSSLWLVMSFSGDRWWLATLVLFGPRWITALPLVILVPLAVLKNRRLLLPLLAGALVVFGPFMGIRFPTAAGEVHPASGPVVRVLTCNIEKGSFNASKLSTLIRDTQPDIVALQECPNHLKLKLPAGWQTMEEGELAVLSRFPLMPGRLVKVSDQPSKWSMTSMLQCVVKAPGGDFAFCSVHLPTPRFGLQALLDKKTFLKPARRELLLREREYRRLASKEVHRAVASLPLPVILAGDFNMPVESTIYRDSWKVYTNVFSQAGYGYGWTAWRGVRWLEYGVRIDHVLVGHGMKVLLCETGPDVGSDHLPLLTDIARETN